MFGHFTILCMKGLKSRTISDYSLHANQMTGFCMKRNNEVKWMNILILLFESTNGSSEYSC